MMTWFLIGFSFSVGVAAGLFVAWLVAVFVKATFL